MQDLKPARGELSDFYIIGPSIAFGAFGEVYSVIHKKSRQIRAAKKVLKKNDQKTYENNFLVNASKLLMSVTDSNQTYWGP